MTAPLDRRSPEWADTANFLGGYLHQDFDAEYATPWAGVVDFGTGTAPTVRSDVAAGVRRLLMTFDGDADLESAATSLGMAYYPPGDGYSSYRVWLTAVADYLDDPEAHPGPPERDAPLPG